MSVISVKCAFLKFIKKFYVSFFAKQKQNQKVFFDATPYVPMERPKRHAPEHRKVPRFKIPRPSLAAVISSHKHLSTLSRAERKRKQELYEYRYYERQLVATNTVDATNLLIDNNETLFAPSTTPAIGYSGRSAFLQTLEFRINLEIVPVSTSTLRYPISIFFAVVEDTQTNGAQLEPSNVYYDLGHDGDTIQPIRNDEWIHRYNVLATRRVYLERRIGATRVGLGAIQVTYMPYIKSIKMKVPVNKVIPLSPFATPNRVEACPTFSYSLLAFCAPAFAAQSAPFCRYYLKTTFLS